jgi:hypothetical protein
VLRNVRDQILTAVPDGVYRDGVAAALGTVFRLLRERGQQLIWLGLLLAAIAYLAGPGRLPVQLRTGIAKAGRAGAARTSALAGHGPAWLVKHRDAVRLGGLALAAALALILSSWAALLAVGIALAVFELLITLATAPRQARTQVP